MSGKDKDGVSGPRPRWATAFDKSPLRPYRTNGNIRSSGSQEGWAGLRVSNNSISEGEGIASAQKRVVSLDSSSVYSRSSGSNNCSSSSSKSAGGKRAHSSSASSTSMSMSSNQLMQRLKFEATQVENTPLSSKRSCSEFQKFPLPKRGNNMTNTNRSEDDKKTSFFSKLFSWGRSSHKKNDAFLEANDDDKSFVVQQLTSRDNNDTFYESLNDPLYSSSENAFSTPPSSKRTNASPLVMNTNRTNSCNNNNYKSISSSMIDDGDKSFSASFFRSRSRTDAHSYSFSSSFRSPSRDTEVNANDSFSYLIPDSPTRKYRKPAPRSSILYETSVALDVLFGFKGTNGFDGCMEIELQDLKHVNRRQRSLDSVDSSSNGEEVRTRNYLNSLRSSTSFTNLSNLAIGADSWDISASLSSSSSSTTTMTQQQQQQQQSSSSETSSTAVRNNSSNIDNNNSSNHNNINSGNDGSDLHSDYLSDAIPKRNLILEKFNQYWSSYESLVVFIGNKYIMSSNSDSLYEKIRVQPFSSGAYLRGLLGSGYASFFMTIYTLFISPPSPAVQNHSQIETLWKGLYYYLIFQLVVNLLQMPFRISVHRYCWESSKAADVQSAILILRDLLQSNSWAANLILGRIVDIFSIIFLVFGEIYLFYCKYSDGDPLRPIVVSISTTCVLTFMIRIFVSTLFCISLHDPMVLSDARKRGLSACDIDALSTFTFTSAEQLEVQNQLQCTICLESYSEGETLLCLPCNGKHCFHADCIREWLHKTNSCPLCQKMI